MIRIGAFDRHLEPLAWWEVELLPAGWYVDELLVEPAAGGVTGTVTSTLSDATLSATGTLVTPSTSSAILITGSNNPSYRSGFYSPRRGGTPKYPSLWDGCVAAWAPSLGATGGRLFDHSAYGNHGTLTDMDAASDWVVSGGKGALDFDGSDDRIIIPNRESLNPKAITLSIWAYDSTSSEGSYRGLIMKRDGGESNIAAYAFDRQKSGETNGNAECRFYFNTAGTWNIWRSDNLNHAKNIWEHLCVVYSAGSAPVFYRNGIVASAVATLGSGSPDLPSNNTTLLLGTYTTYSGDDRPWSGLLDDARVYNRALSAKEIRTLALRRGIAFERASRKLSVSSAAAPTGSLSSTLADATLSSSGTLASGLTGSLSGTLADATLSATGTLTNAATGSLSSTLANATLSATGTLAAGASGTLSRTLDAVTLSSSGTIGSGLTGTVSVTLGAATLSSSGTVAAGASGTVTRTLDNATLSSTGGAAGTVTGSVSATLAAVTCSATGTLTAGLSGTVVRTLDAVTSSATGTVTNGASGTVTRTLADATLASGGSLSAGLTAQVNRALESCVVSSSGTLASGLTGTLSVQLASATLQSGNVAVGGLRIKVGGEWKNASAFVKVTGTWRTATPYVKVGGVWK